MGEDRAASSLTEFPGREFLVEELETGMPTSEVSRDTAKGVIRGRHSLHMQRRGTSHYCSSGSGVEWGFPVVQ